MKCPVCDKRIQDENKELYTNILHLNHDNPVWYDTYSNKYGIVYCTEYCMRSQITKYLELYNRITDKKYPYVKIDYENCSDDFNKPVILNIRGSFRSCFS